MTFDDGPHETLTNSKTIAIIETLKAKAEQYEKQIQATFFVEKTRIDSHTGKTILKDHTTANEHEIGIHGVDPVAHHKKHQDTDDLQDELIDMKSRIVDEDAGGQTAVSVRPPGGWGAWNNGTVSSKNEVETIYGNVDLRRYNGEGTEGGGVNSWGTLYPSENGTPTGSERTAFIKTITDVIDDAVANSETKKLVVLMHDLRTPDKDDIGNVIDDVETYATANGAIIEYVRIKDLP